jgi:hypothetical protein
MSFFNNIQSYNARVVDVGLIKIAVLSATLLIAKLWTPILSLDWYWYLIVFILAAIKPLINFFKSNLN